VQLPIPSAVALFWMGITLVENFHFAPLYFLFFDCVAVVGNQRISSKTSVAMAWIVELQSVVVLRTKLINQLSRMKTKAPFDSIRFEPNSTKRKWNNARKKKRRSADNDKRTSPAK
jgi:hypothetical protein